MIDKTYSKTISDETKFYTSDTALELGFELKETEYTFESAEIVLLNVDDRSLVTRPVSKANNDFVYELDDDITAHYGEWRGQLRFEAGETYVSSPVKFRIENDLSNDRPPQLSDVQSWVSLKRYADELTEELKQAVLSIEGVEDTFSENETGRQNQFETAEQSRQTTFETNEIERDETFNANEATRQTQELEREKAEDARQQAETQRSSAESSRVSAEEQRKIDHANRSAELAGKADKVVLNNLIDNGDFSDGTTGWVATRGRYAVVNQIMDVIGDGTNPNMIVRAGLITPHSSGRKLYIRGRVRTTSPNCIRIQVRTTNNGYSGGVNAFAIDNPTQDMWYSFSGVNTLIMDLSDLFLNVYFQYADSESSNNQIGQIDGNHGILVVDLTETFGAGNEPTKEEMDELIKVTGYIDGEYALNSKELLMWTLSLVRSNRNAIIALGGTI